VIASRWENFPMVGLEALAAGRPVICTDRVGLAEILTGTGAGTVVPTGDHEALALALRPYLADAGAAAAAGERGRRLVRELCAPDEIAAERERCYYEALARRASGARHNRVALSATADS
jgi:glycogen(starch) synthase